MRSEKRRIFSALFFSGLLFLLLDSFLIFAEYGHYQQKYQMASLLLGNSQTDLQILKNGGLPSMKEAEGVLSQYGYESIRSTFFGEEFIHHCLWIITGSALCFLGTALVLFYVRCRQRKDFESLLEEISAMLEDFRSGNFRTDLLWEHLEDDASRIKDIYMQMESLGSYFEQLKEAAAIEKENTKSLVTDISHQLKTPMAALKASLEILDQEDLNEGERKEFLKRCQDQMTGLEQLSSALIQISRMETGMIRLQMEEKRIFDTVLLAVNRIIPKAEDKKIAVELEIPEPLQTLILSHDTKWMTEALINLMDNAVKYSPEGSRIRISMDRWINFLHICVEDEGIGIPKEEQHKVFQRFYRGGAREVRCQQGSGIGLFLTREIINRHCGTIKVISGGRRKQKGSLFQIQLPVTST